MSTTTTVFLNSKAGQLMTVDEADMNEMVRQYLGERAGIVLLDPPEQFRALEEAYASAIDNIISVGGGDGTVSAAARLAVKKHKSIGVLPLGTMNLLARALGMPLQLDAAAQKNGGCSDC